MMQAFPVDQLVKNSPAKQETLVQFLDWEDPLEEGIATHSSILAWRIPWKEKPDGLQSMGLQLLLLLLLSRFSRVRLCATP